MSHDMFAESEPMQVTCTPMKAPRTPSMTPTRSGRRRRPSISDRAPKPDSKYFSQPVRTEDFYDLRNRLVPLNDNELWLQYGIKPSPQIRSSVNFQPNLREETTTSTKEEVKHDMAERQRLKEKVFNFAKCLRMLTLIIISAFLGACCYAYIEHNLLFTDNYRCHPQIEQDVQMKESEDSTYSSHLESSVVRLSEELKYLRNHCNKIQENQSSEVLPHPQRGVLEELLVADLVSAGNLGSVLATPQTITYTVPTTITLLWLFSFTVQLNHRSPTTTIEGLIQEVGDCWPFLGSQGRLVLKLHRSSHITGVSISHIPSSLIVSGDISSAPRIFQMWSLSHIPSSLIVSGDISSAPQIFQMWSLSHIPSSLIVSGDISSAPRIFQMWSLSHIPSSLIVSGDISSAPQIFQMWSLSHIPSSLIVSGDISSAPRIFQMWSLSHIPSSLIVSGDISSAPQIFQMWVCIL
ncbi:uncharacterized protein LOC128999557 [Macrosteles quadrilineatus]|uniref:uncharacterized protein LOC128999557 n=1 Tax=Macrosteles quadrilineatus TaxID=74068 RepID=UPI0023E08FF6|nr:uncharacterized protein LOC128999557 [Macrosteles quadrilineatus]